MHKQETITTRLLLLIYESVIVPWTDISMAVPNASYVATKRQMRKAMKDGLLEFVQVKGIPKRYVTLTVDGIAHLERVFGIRLRYVSGETKFSSTLPMKKQRRLARVGECLPFLMGANVYVLQREKPTLGVLARSMFDSLGSLGTMCIVATPVEEGEIDGDTAADDTPTPVLDPWSPERPVIEDEADLDFLLGYGIFYTSGEIREYAKTLTFLGDLSGAIDVMGRSRFVGIVFKRKEYYIIYNSRDNLMTWYEGIEEKTEATIRQMFSRYKGYEAHNTRNELGKLPAVVFGETMALLPALVTGHKAGTNKSVKHNKYPRTYRQISADTKVYAELYFVPTEKVGLEVLAETLTNTREEKHQRVEKFFDGKGPAIFVKRDGLLPYGHSSDHFVLVYMPIFDVKFIRWVRERKERVLVATYQCAANSVSKSLGLRLIGGMDFHVNDEGMYPKLEYKKFDNDGRLQG